MEKYKALTDLLGVIAPRHPAKLGEKEYWWFMACLFDDKDDIALGWSVAERERRLLVQGIDEPWDDLSDAALEQVDRDTLAQLICGLADGDFDSLLTRRQCRRYVNDMTFYRYLHRLKTLEWTPKALRKLEWESRVPGEELPGRWILDCGGYTLTKAEMEREKRQYLETRWELSTHQVDYIEQVLAEIRPETWSTITHYQNTNEQMRKYPWSLTFTYTDGTVISVTGDEGVVPQGYEQLIHFFFFTRDESVHEPQTRVLRDLNVEGVPSPEIERKINRVSKKKLTKAEIEQFRAESRERHRQYLARLDDEHSFWD